MEFYELANKRYSCRKYKDQVVEKEKIEKILEAGRIAPSAVNYQPWHFIVVNDKIIKEKLDEAYERSWFQTAPAALIICGDHSKSWKRKDGKDHCDIDAAIATDHITLQAAELGLATCWVCNFDIEKCREILGLPNHIEPVVILPLGYPDDTTSKFHHIRKKSEEIIHWNKF